jgi:hypothetical protein
LTVQLNPTDDRPRVDGGTDEGTSLVIFVALTLGTAVTQQAIACDWQREANYTPVIVADCTTANCAIEQPTTGEAQEPKQKIANELSCRCARVSRRDNSTTASSLPNLRVPEPEVEKAKQAGGKS